jgi:hypothetical protein
VTLAPHGETNGFPFGVPNESSGLSPLPFQIYSYPWEENNLFFPNPSFYVFSNLLKLTARFIPHSEIIAKNISFAINLSKNQTA